MSAPDPTLLCPSCGARAPGDARSFVCACGDLFELPAPAPPLARDAAPRFGAPGLASGVWRFHEVLPCRLSAEGPVLLGEGNTPLYPAPSVAAWTGIERLALKHEGMNPTGSFKDRGMTVVVSHARGLGARRVVCASTGNTSASLAAYARAAGLEAVILVPETATALGKLSQALAYGARTLQIRGDFDAAMGLVRELSEPLSLYPCNSINPFRLEGQKTIVLELLEQRGWRVPDWLVFPAGNLGNTAAFGKALREARELGWIDRLPRLAAVQAAGAAPFAAAYEGGFQALEPVRAETVATAIRIGNPVSYRRAVRAMEATDGRVCAVDDAAILEAKAVVDAAGIGAEPASCASVAGARHLVQQGVIAPDEDVVCVLTGHLLKDPETTLRYHRADAELGACERANAPVVIDPTERGLRDALEREVVPSL